MAKYGKMYPTKPTRSKRYKGKSKGKKSKSKKK